MMLGDKLYTKTTTIHVLKVNINFQREKRNFLKNYQTQRHYIFNATHWINIQLYRYCNYRWHYTDIVKHIGIVIIADGIPALWLLSWVSLTYWYCDYYREYLWPTGIVITLVLSLTYWYCEYSCVISDIIPVLWLLSWLSLTGIFV